MQDAPSTRKEATKNKFLEDLKRKKSGKISGNKPAKPEEEAPRLRVDLFWIWAAFCFLNERRQVGPNGPQPITTEAIFAYANLSRRTEPEYLQQLVHLIPVLDRIMLKDFYDKQQAQMDEMRKKQEHKTRLAAEKTGSRSIGR